MVERESWQFLIKVAVLHHLAPLCITLCCRHCISLRYERTGAPEWEASLSFYTFYTFFYMFCGCSNIDEKLHR